MADRIAGCFQHAFGTFFVAATIALAGCASDIMKNYIGQPVESVFWTTARRRLSLILTKASAHIGYKDIAVFG